LPHAGCPNAITRSRKRASPFTFPYQRTGSQSQCTNEDTRTELHLEAEQIAAIGVLVGLEKFDPKGGQTFWRVAARYARIELCEYAARGEFWVVRDGMWRTAPRTANDEQHLLQRFIGRVGSRSCFRRGYWGLHRDDGDVVEAVRARQLFELVLAALALEVLLNLRATRSSRRVAHAGAHRVGVRAVIGRGRGTRPREGTRRSACRIKPSMTFASDRQQLS
jgi:hypothetical protein